MEDKQVNINNQTIIAKLLVILEHAKERPGMYFSNIETADSFLRGFGTAVSVYLEVDEVYRIRVQVTNERGWPRSSREPWDEMISTGMSEEQVIGEMLNIEIEVWKRVSKIITHGEG